MAERAIRLEFPAYDGRTQARILHGARCVIVLIEPVGDRWVAMHGSIVLAPDEATALGQRLIEEAAAAERPYG